MPGSSPAARESWIVLHLKDPTTQKGDPMKFSIPFTFVCMAALTGCSVPVDESEDDGMADLEEPVGSVEQASYFSGVHAIVTSCQPGTPGPTNVEVWFEIYGSFDNNGNNVTAKATGGSGLSLTYQYSNYRSSSQVNLKFSAYSTSGCPTQFIGWVYDGATTLGPFSATP
jgi:hypothetical protein